MNITPLSKTVPKETFNYNKGDYIGLNEYLLITCNFSVFYNVSDLEEMWITLKEHILNGMNLFIQNKTKNSSVSDVVYLTTTSLY